MAPDDITQMRSLIGVTSFPCHTQRVHFRSQNHCRKTSLHVEAKFGFSAVNFEYQDDRRSKKRVLIEF